MKTGLKHTEKLTVRYSDTAAALGSGLLPIFSTPSLITLMETAAYNSVSCLLPDGETTVGTSVDIKHLSPAPVGMTVTCDSELIEIDRKRLVFKVVVYDDEGVVLGEGIHERFIISIEKFMIKTLSKLDK